jgi:AcrR family transcriptional regulator
MATRPNRAQRDREVRHDRMRARILKAAMTLFLKRGFTNITMRSIAAKIGYTPGAIYRYFTDKDEIFFALRGEGFALFYETQMAARRSRDPMERLRQHAAAYVDFALRHPEYYELMFILPAPIERAIEREEWTATRRSLDLLRDDLRAAIEAGGIRSADVDTAAFAIWSLLHGMIALIRRRRAVLHVQGSHEQLVSRILEYLHSSLLTA